jgi:glycosyltransferase involved in cell wall biosynthesis
MRHRVVFVTSSYPRFPGDAIGSFMEPIARSVARRGHDVHVVAPWHPTLRRPDEERVRFHFFKYAPVRRLNVFGYAQALRADTDLTLNAWLAAPLALVAGWRAVRRVAREIRATVLHAHWVVPGGAIAALAGSAPLVVSLHGSDVYVAERHGIARRAAAAAFRRARAISACSDDLARRAVAIGADPDRVTVVPYGVDADRFRPDRAARAAVRSGLGLTDAQPLVFAAGRLVSKKGFEYLIDAAALLAERGEAPTVAIAGGGDLEPDLRRRARDRGIAERVRFVGVLDQADVARHLAAADVAVVPSVRDDRGNVDGLPNVVLEALASGTSVVTTRVGGIAAVAEHDRTALVVPYRDAGALAAAIAGLLESPDRRAALGGAARDVVAARFGWDRAAERFEALYDRASS